MSADAHEGDPSQPGLHAPEGPLGLLERPRRLTPARVAVQLVVFAAWLALIGWCLALAFSPDSRAEMARLREAPAWMIVALLALSGASVVVNGVGFWITARPLKPLPMGGVLAVNALASFLAYLPLKMGAAARVLIHRRRDGMLFRQIIPWLAGYAAMSASMLAAMGAMALWRGRIDGVWLVGAGALVVLAGVCAVALGRLAERWKWLAMMSLGSWRVVREPGVVASFALVRVVDVGIQAARFAVAAAIFETAMPASRSVLYAVVYFFLGAASPAGALGLREGAVVMLGERRDELARLVVTVTAADAVTLAVLALGAAAYLRPDRLMRSGAIV